MLKLVGGTLVLIGILSGFWRGLVDGVLGPWMSGAQPAQAPGPVVVLALVLTVLPFLLLGHLGKK